MKMDSDYKEEVILVDVECRTCDQIIPRRSYTVQCESCLGHLHSDCVIKCKDCSQQFCEKCLEDGICPECEREHRRDKADKAYLIDMMKVIEVHADMGALAGSLIEKHCALACIRGSVKAALAFVESETK
jgi:hypothetical protein